MSKALSPIEKSLRKIKNALDPLTDEQREAVMTSVRILMEPPPPPRKQRAAKKQSHPLGGGGAFQP
jgi:hypothetical protein